MIVIGPSLRIAGRRESREALRICRINMPNVLDMIANMTDDRNETERGPTIGVVTKRKPKTQKPSLYRVLLLNDDFTPMEFVIEVLERYFQKSPDDATRIMLHVHQKGVGVCGVFTYEIAETKVNQVVDFARRSEHPLQCTMEKA